MRSIREIFRSYAVLNERGIHVNGTDKESNHNYGDAYERIIADYFTTGPWHPKDLDFGRGRETVKLFMEVGVADGSCLLAWREVFPNATIVGMDIHHSDKAHGERIEFHIGDQRDRTDCERTAAGRLFDVIVEDASHRLEDTLLTLSYLWKSVRPGGLYIVEEFANIGELRSVIEDVFRAEVVETIGPFGGVEPLVVFRKPLS